MDVYIKTIYKKTGQVEVQPVGFGGQLCQKATAPYTAGLGNAHMTITGEACMPEQLPDDKARNAPTRLREGE
jgi:hypothetical protein